MSNNFTAERKKTPCLSVINCRHMLWEEAGTSWLAGSSLWTGFLLSLGQMGRGGHTPHRLVDPLFQAATFWAAATLVEGRVSVSADFMVQLGAWGSFGLCPDSFPEPWFSSVPLPNQMTPSSPSTLGALSIYIGGGGCRGHRKHDLEPRAEKSSNKEVY